MDALDWNNCNIEIINLENVNYTSITYEIRFILLINKGICRLSLRKKCSKL